MLSDDDFRLLLYHLDRPWAGFRKVRKGVKKKVRRHMAALECSTIQDYLQNIVRDPEARAECERLKTDDRIVDWDVLLWSTTMDQLYVTSGGDGQTVVSSFFGMVFGQGISVLPGVILNFSSGFSIRSWII